MAPRKQKKDLDRREARSESTEGGQAAARHACTPQKVRGSISSGISIESRVSEVKPRRADDATRIVLVALSRLIEWRRILTIVKPDTLIRWHRKRL